jgi:hypothetical protein
MVAAVVTGRARSAAAFITMFETQIILAPIFGRSLDHTVGYDPTLGL